jgi:hypothetical protein
LQTTPGDGDRYSLASYFPPFGGNLPRRAVTPVTWGEPEPACVGGWHPGKQRVGERIAGIQNAPNRAADERFVAFLLAGSRNATERFHGG